MGTGQYRSAHGARRNPGRNEETSALKIGCGDLSVQPIRGSIVPGPGDAGCRFFRSRHMHFSRVDFAGPDRQRRMCAGWILAAGAGGFYRPDRDQRASAGGRAGAVSVDPRPRAVFRWPALRPQLPETGVSARGSVDPARIQRQFGDRLSAEPAGAADSPHLEGQPDHQGRRRDQGRANPPKARRGWQADARFAARHFCSPFADCAALGARPYRGKYRPQDLPPSSVERIGRTHPAANDVGEPALRGAGVAAGAGLDLVGLCGTVSRPGAARHHAVLAVLGRDRHPLADRCTSRRGFDHPSQGRLLRSLRRHARAAPRQEKRRCRDGRRGAGAVVQRKRPVRSGTCAASVHRAAAAIAAAAAAIAQLSRAALARRVVAAGVVLAERNRERSGRRFGDRRHGLPDQLAGRRRAGGLAVHADRELDFGRAADDLAGGRNLARGDPLPAKRKDFWGGVAQMLTVAGLLVFPYDFATIGVPQLAGIYEIVSGDAHVGPHEFHVLANGQTLEFSGGITFGVTQELERFLDAKEGVRTVRLNSNGGRILEAQRMSDLISSRNLATFVARDCLSACTIVFLGGKERFMLPTARLGFHQPAFRGMTASDRRAAIATEQRRLQQRFGLSAAFAARANSAPPGGMWYPDKDELMRERVVTRLVSPKQVLPSPTDAPTANAAPSSADGEHATPVARAPVPAIRIPGTGEPTASVGAAADGAVRAKIPAELLKRLAAQPRKPVAIPPAAAR